MTVTTAVVVLPRRVAVWASRRAVARTSVTGIELACALCAAVWFSAGTPLTALAGGAALGGGYLARRVGGQLTVGAFDGWLAGACALAGELVVYAGLAAGAAPGQARGWPPAPPAALLLGVRQVARPGPDSQAGTAPAPGTAARRGPGPVRRTDMAAARDDGPLARFAGALVRGQLVPLPPAVAGLTATVLLATLGLRDLAGLVLLTP